ncbi:MAG TPA: DsbC family protein [Burkholderiales bacterium]|jgi:thiol:disulfide interchange protein DsbC|nr:DsbC family protein [Burkholderiales bacterium]
MKPHRILSLSLALVALFAGAACADESSIRAEMAKKFPKAALESVTKLPNVGLYELVVDGQIYYTDDKFGFLFAEGVVIETRGMTNLTQARLQELEDQRLKKLAFPFDQLPFDLAFKKVKGNGSRKVAVFSDPDCPFCRRLEKSLTQLDNVTIYTFLYPLAQLHPKAPEIARAIWCSPDKAKAWDDYMLNGVAPKAAGTCQNPVDKVVEFGQGKRISGTPTLFFEDGRRVPGAIPLDQIEQYLAQAQGTR